MTILRIYLFAMISVLFLFGGTWGAAAGAGAGKCYEGYSQCAKPCAGKDSGTARTACLKHCEKKYCVSAPSR
jgi:hypothetical protein